MQKATLSIPADKVYLGPLLLFCREAARAKGFAAERTARFSLAVEETALAIVERGFSDGKNKSFLVDVFYGEDGLTVIFRENGEPFSPELFQGACGGGTPANAEEELSLRIIKRSADGAEFSRQGKEGLRVSLRMDSRGALPSAAQEAEPEAAIRLASEKDALAAAECAYESRECLRESFLCDPKVFAAEIKSGKIVSAIAVGKDGRVLGHAALRAPACDGADADVCAEFTRPRLRRSRLMLRLLAFLSMEAERRRIPGLTLTADLDDSFRIDAALRLGFIFCGIFLAGNTAKLFLKLSDTPARVVYPPPAWQKQMLASLSACGCKAIPGENAEPARQAPEKGDLRRVQAHAADSAVFEIHRIGRDTRTRLLAELRKATKEKKSGVCLRVNLQDPGCPALCAGLAKSGFFYAGVLPIRLEGKHCVLLQNSASAELPRLNAPPADCAEASLLETVLRSREEAA